MAPVVPDMQHPLEMAEREDGETTVVVLSGELDMDTVAPVERRLDELADEGRATVLDLDGLDFMDSVGIRLVLRACESAQRDGWAFRVSRGSEAVQRVFAASGLTDRLPYC
jgi:anti-anti-sigma factor